MSPAVEISNVRKSYGAVEVLKGVSLNVRKGELVAIIGRSGSGKSTLLRCINGLERIDFGTIRVGPHTVGRDAAGLRRLRQDVGIVFQSYNLFPHLTVEQNIVLAPNVVKRLSRSESSSIAREVLAQVGLSDKAAAYPDQLSGGQQQRVAIARSLAMQPQVMLFDEVTSALDPELTGEVLKVMENLARTGITMILVTHEMGFARTVANTVVFMHQGKIWESGGAADMFGTPRTAELRQFIGSALK